MSKMISLVHGRKAERQHKKAKGKRRLCLQVKGAYPSTVLAGFDGWSTLESMWFRVTPAPGELSEAQALSVLASAKERWEDAGLKGREFRVAEEEIAKL